MTFLFVVKKRNNIVIDKCRALALRIPLELVRLEFIHPAIVLPYINKIKQHGIFEYKIEHHIIPHFAFSHLFACCLRLQLRLCLINLGLKYCNNQNISCFGNFDIHFFFFIRYIGVVNRTISIRVLRFP